MQVKIEIQTYRKEEGLRTTWEDDFTISTRIEDESILISANSAGLISLAKQLLTLAQENVPSGCHFHFDDLNCLEEGSSPLVIEKKNIF